MPTGEGSTTWRSPCVNRVYRRPKSTIFRKEWRQLLEQILGCYSTILPFEKAKLTTIKVSGDPNSPPMYSKVDLSHLLDEDINLATVLPKCNTQGKNS